MTKTPHIVDGAWLEAHLEDDNLRIIDASTFLKIPEEGYLEIWSGAEAAKHHLRLRHANNF
ncbi:hypothetical protein [Kurthia massiliensis]|uniref:hypothetical protein n=1 Tax=Kurthia massiliensis TaxID=1033739 RepID=UPI000289AE75|nr:hypothetical protein [Kurthia massiliensis]